MFIPLWRAWRQQVARVFRNGSQTRPRGPENRRAMRPRLEHLEDRLAPTADVAITETASAFVSAGAPLTYTVTLTNNGPDAATGVVLTDALTFNPASGIFVPGSGAITPAVTNPDSFTNILTPLGFTSTANADIPSGNSDTFFLSFGTDATAPNGGTVTSDASVTGTNIAGAGPTTASVTTTVTQPTTLTLTKDGPDTATAGTNATYTLTLTNTGAADAFNVNLTDMLPAGETVLSERQTGGPDLFTDTTAGNTPSFNVATMGTGNTDTFQVIAAIGSGVADGSILTETASVTAANSPTNSASADTAIGTSANLAVSKTGPATVTAGADATYTITITNAGPSDAQGVLLSDTLPTGGTFVSITPAAGNPDNFAPFTVSGGGLSSNPAGVTVAAGNTDVFTLVESAASSLASGAAFDDTASVTTTTSNTSTETSATVVGTVADTANLVLTKTGPASATEGDTITYTLSLTNTGPSDAQGVVVTDILPDGESLVSATLGGVTGVVFGNTIVFTIGTVPAGTQAVTGTVVVQVVEDGTLVDTASVVSNTFNSNGGSSTVRATTTVAEGPLVITGTTLTGTEFTALDNVTVATFAHANGLEPVSAFTPRIDWGDGTATSATIGHSGTTYVIQASHTYVDEGNFTITVTIAENGAFASGTSTASIGESSLPSGVPSDSTHNTIYETMDDLFRSQLSAFQVNSVALALMAVELSAANQLQSQGLDSVTAFLLAQQLGMTEFNLFAHILAANGATLRDAVSGMVTGFLLQAGTEQLGAGA
jgi:uncharacterized repeat protein (TIGR01451 family)